MIKRLSILLIAVMLAPAFIIAQEHTVLTADGKIIKHKGDLKTLETRSSKKLTPIFTQMISSNSSSPSSILGIIDTLDLPGPWATNAFVENGQDVMLQWYEAPADLYIQQIGFAPRNNTVFTQSLEIKVVKVNWSVDDLKNQTVARRGYYEATGNGYHDITAFQDNLDYTGPWVSLDGSPEPFGHDIWSDGGVGWTEVGIVESPDPYTYQWVDLSVLGYSFVAAGEVFGIAIKELETEIGAGDGVSYWYGTMGLPGWKFYADGRLDPPNDFGWWSREFTWDFVAEVDVVGDPAPSINSVTQIASGLDLGPFTVDANITDINAGDPTQAGIASANLYWSIDGGTSYTAATMAGTEPNYTGEIPAQVPGTTVEYYVEATDVNAHTSVGVTYSFYVYGPSGANTLIVFNGFTTPTGYPQSYYFGIGDFTNYNTLEFAHDVWSYGPLVTELVNNYTNIIEFCSNGPNDINSDVIRTWIDADGGHNYMLAGDEWLGAQSGWTDGPHAAGDFIFDILGINYEYNDINYGATGDDALPSEVYPQSGSLLGGNLFDLYTSVSSANGWTSPMLYDPTYEISVANWLDAVDFESDVVVDMMGKPVSGPDKVIGGHRTLPAGNKIAFFGLDLLSLDSDTENEVEYYWYGFTEVAPQVETLKWFGYTDVKRENELIPSSFKLSQNYPNPFNPSTTISFALPMASKVVLKVYDVLGKEVATLLDGEKGAGNYQVNFDASKLASGLYIYTINAGSFTSTKKMMLMK